MTSSRIERSRSRFREIVSGDDEQIDLAEAALLIAAEEYPAVDMNIYIERLDLIANSVRDRVRDDVDPELVISALNFTLFDELGFRGNQESYYDPRNSFLNQVIDRRIGIPITLTVVYMEVARRIGFAVYGVGLPSHFIAGHSGEAGEVYIDPFNQGRVLGRAGVEKMFSELGGGAVELKEEHLAPVRKKQIITRMLSNLLNIYLGNYSGAGERYTDYARALRVMERVILINPSSAAHVRDYGLLLAANGKMKEAIEELERYIARAPDAADAESIRNQIYSIRREQAKFN
ncbi:MAG TPA: transglutaminase-like domain-containing protein [Blastocatellia bacterium]|nr:transglutaminase-like domain-containing protein [Blastocatellia bacterium]